MNEYGSKSLHGHNLQKRVLFNNVLKGCAIPKENLSNVKKFLKIPYYAVPIFKSGVIKHAKKTVNW